MDLKSLETKTKETRDKVKASRVSKFLGEFKTFAVKGNVIDLAVGVIIGTAFSKIVSSVVADIAMPIIGMFLGGVDFSTWTVQMPRLFNQEKANPLNIGVFINNVIEFIILAFIVFLFVKFINKMKKKPQEKTAEPPAPTTEELLLTEIRDLLKEQNERK
jgi:large conductance mechanosensitive channel